MKESSPFPGILLKKWHCWSIFNMTNNFKKRKLYYDFYDILSSDAELLKSKKHFPYDPKIASLI